MKIEWKNYPADIIICLAWSFATIPAVILDLKATRIVLGLAFILFIPGYVLVFALFPKRDDIDVIERIALSFGLSIAVVPLVGLALNYTPWGIRLQPILASLISLVFVLSAIGWYRWKSLPVKDRFQISIDISLPKAEDRELYSRKPKIRKLYFPKSKSKRVYFPKTKISLDNILTIALVIAIIISISLLIYVIVMPHNGERFTEFYILGPDGKAEGYPTNLSVGENGTVIVGIANHEHKPMNYTVEVWGVNYSYQPEFDGKNDYISVENNETLNPTKGITIDTRVKPADSQPWNFLGKSGSYIVGINEESIHFGIYDPDAKQADKNGYVTVSATGNFSGWHHVACTYDSTSREMHIYVNGSNMANMTTTGGDGLISTSNSSLYIGKVWGKHFNGTIGYVRIYSRALSVSELSQNYNGNVITNGLISEWDFNEWQDVMKDRVGNNNGKIYGMPWRISGISNMWFMDKIEVQLNSTPVNIEKEWKKQWEYNYSFNFTRKGQYKLAFLLFADDKDNFTAGKDYPEESGRLSEAYRECHLWITVHDKSFK